MSLAQLKATGFGTLRFRIMIEGWPEMFVTDPSITCTSIADSRTVLPGLLHEGLMIQDRIIPGEAKVTASGITFKLRPEYVDESTDPMVRSLTVYPEPVASLGASIDSDDTSLSLKGGSTLSNSTVYHLGTEAIRVGTWPTVTRQIWDTQPQEHNLSYYDRTKDVYIYARPPTMEGRHIFLYAYGENDAVTGLGNLIWRGIVSRAPKLDRDCVTWLIEALPITHVLRQNVAGDTTDTHPVGIYHHTTCTFGFYLETASNQARTIYRYPANLIGTPDSDGLDTEQTLMDAVNLLLATALSETGIDAGIDSITLTKDASSAGKFSFSIVAGDTPTGGIRIVGGSPLLGWCDTYLFGMYLTDAADPQNQVQVIGRETLQTFPTGAIYSNVTYTAPLEYHSEGYLIPGNEYAYDGGGVAAPLGHASAIFNDRPGAVDGRHPKQLFQHNTTGGGLDQFPAWRLHVDKALTGASMVHVEGSLDELGNFRVLSVDSPTSKDIAGVPSGFNHITLEQKTEPTPITGRPNTSADQLSRSVGFYGILLAGSSVVPIRRYIAGSVTAFVQALKELSVEANDGDTPFITDADLSTWTLTGDVTSLSVLLRLYAFTRSKSLETILAEECKLAGHLMRIEADGRIGIIRLPVVTDVATVDTTHTITGADIITPGGTFGAWPEVEPQRDGLITTISLQEWYDAIADDWTDQPRVYQDADAIATHKTRGKSPMSITPYSRPQAFDKNYGRLLASRLLAFFARDYMVVTIKVMWPKFDILCGDTVSLTHRLIPDGLGSRGIVSRRGVVIDRRWNLDPAMAEFGTLSIWINGQPTSGYAPGGLVTDQTDEGSNLWLLTIDPAEDYNIQVSSNGDGLIAQHFQTGYAVKIIQTDDDTPTIVTGTVTDVDVDAGEVQVQFSGVWVPGVFNWFLEFDDHGACTTDQRKYAFAAGDNLALSDGSFARRLA